MGKKVTRQTMAKATMRAKMATMAEKTRAMKVMMEVKMRTAMVTTIVQAVVVQ